MSSQRSSEKAITRPATDKNDRGELKAPPSTFLLPLNVAFYICLISHALAALYAPIQDCDETFNYWEPLHYLTHGYGLETWEYSPDYSIRSWAYILLHAVPVKIFGFLGKSKTSEFYFLRLLLAVVCAATETRLYSAICKHLNPRIGVFYLMIVAFSPGSFYASTALLPSSFAMYTSSLGLVAFMDRSQGPRLAQGIFWFAMGTLLGWPFAGALIIPFIVEDGVLALANNDYRGIVLRYVEGAMKCLSIIIPQLVTDYAFYNKFVFVPWKIVSYNVFSGSGQGPDIFGTEPWHFYIRNLLLNFSIWTPFALAAVPLLVLQVVLSGQRTTKQAIPRLAVLITPFYMWLAIFTVQPHKEERFMYPAYPFLALNASIALHILLTWIGTSSPNTLIGQIPSRVKLVLALLPVLLATNLGLLRILGTVTAYQAPFQAFNALSMQANLTSADNICISKEWYRFPSSFFLPNSSHVRFVKSEFDGLLPGQFMEATRPFEILRGAQRIPLGMNNRNEEDFSKYVSVDECSYLIDSRLPSWTATTKEPNYFESQEWNVISCAEFLDAQSTHLIARTVWVPDIFPLPTRFRRVWGKYCLLQRRNSIARG